MPATLLNERWRHYCCVQYSYGDITGGDITWSYGGVIIALIRQRYLATLFAVNIDITREKRL